uniref:Uncharacterized protein n=1 Tax=Arundo donax TaxID=35708 RepID=A0A0A8YGB1_ARUDO
MPHRNYDHGDQYKNTESCPARDGSQLGSDSRPLKENEEFAKEEAMEKDFTNGCSRDDIPKRRKLTHAARRLFSDGDY